MSFDIEKRFRFVSSDGINDDVDEKDYQDVKIDIGEEKFEEVGGLKNKKGIIEDNTEEVDKNLDDFDKEEDDEEEGE